MAYATGTAISLNALYDALDTFIAANGWTLTDTITTRDKVYHSVGTDSKRSMYARLTSSAEAGNPFKSANDYHKAVPNILVRGYQNWTPSTGLNEFGFVGPLIAAGQVETTQQTFFYHPFEVSPVPTTYSAIRAKGLSTNLAGLFQWGRFGQERQIYGGTASGFSAYDLTTGETITATTGISMQNNQLCVVYIAATNTTYVYGLANTGTLTDQLWRWNPDSGEIVRMAPPIWSATGPSGGGIVWDGSDTLYCLRGTSTVDFAKYSISGNSWTTLTNASSARATYSVAATGTPYNICYLPAAVTGSAEDIITVPLTISGTTLHKYNVTANTWGTVTTGFPLTFGQQSHSFWDGRKYLYVGVTSSGAGGAWQRAAVDGPGIGSFSSLGTIQEGARNFEGSDLINHLSCKLRSSSMTHTYWFCGDADGITAATRIGTQYYWMHFGRFTSNYRSDVMKTTAGATAGNQVTISVDTSANYSVGDEVLIFDPASNKVERQTIQQVPNGTSIALNITNNYGTGSLIGVDPDNFILTGDSGWATTLLDGRGYRTDPLCPSYAIQPQFDNAEERLRYNPSGRGYVLPVPIKIASFYPTLPNTYETRGILKGVFALTKLAFPAPQPEDIIRVDGKQYLIIDPASTKRLATNNFLIVFGPIN